MRSFLGCGLAIAAGLLSASSLLSYGSPIEVSSANPQPTPVEKESSLEDVVLEAAEEIAPPELKTINLIHAERPEAPPEPYVATAYSLPGRTASGQLVRRGIIAADPRVLPFGTRVRLRAGAYSGDYLVADSGGKIKGRKIDVWMPSSREALRFGRRNVKLTVLKYGPRRAPRAKAKQTR